MPLVKFKKAGKWAENDTLLPQFEVEDGGEHECSDALTALIVKAGKGVVITSESEKAESEKAESEKLKKTDPRVNPATKDKSKAKNS